MKNSIYSALFTAATLVVAPVFALGNTVCKNGKYERRVEIVYQEQGKQVPCEVKYTREGADGSTVEKVLYTANAKVGYCEEKATEFAGKLSELGWACSQADSKSSDQ